MSKVTPVAILTSIINLTPISCFCTCSVIVCIKDLTIIWQISCWKHTAYCTQKRFNHEQKTCLPVFLTRIQSQRCFCGSHWSLNAPACAFVVIYAHFRIIFSVYIFPCFFCFRHFPLCFKVKLTNQMNCYTQSIAPKVKWKSFSNWMWRIQWWVVDLTLMIKLLPNSVAKVLPRIELLPGLFLLLAPAMSIKEGMDPSGPCTAGYNDPPITCRLRFDTFDRQLLLTDSNLKL